MSLNLPVTTFVKKYRMKNILKNYFIEYTMQPAIFPNITSLLTWLRRFGLRPCSQLSKKLSFKEKIQNIKQNSKF